MPDFGTDGSHYYSDIKFLHYLLSVERDKIKGLYALMEKYDFSRHDKIFEIGCGDMAQALVIKSNFSQIEYTATDYDPYLIERCSGLSILEGIEKKVVDVTKNLDALPVDNSLIVSFGVDYALEDEQLIGLFSALAERNLEFLMCSPTIGGIIHYLRHKIIIELVRQKMKHQLMRRHGWKRSLRRISKMANASGLSMKCIGKYGNYACMHFSPK